eukprot:2956333-Pyramimonas_sp.AAC.1
MMRAPLCLGLRLRGVEACIFLLWHNLWPCVHEDAPLGIAHWRRLLLRVTESDILVAHPSYASTSTSTGQYSCSIFESFPISKGDSRCRTPCTSSSSLRKQKSCGYSPLQALAFARESFAHSPAYLQAADLQVVKVTALWTTRHSLGPGSTFRSHHVTFPCLCCHLSNP